MKTLTFTGIRLMGMAFCALNTAKAQIVKVKVTFDKSPSYASATFADLKYNKNAVFNFEQDDRNPGMMNVLAYFTGGIAPVDGVVYPGKYFTDGCGNNVNYRAAIAVNARRNFDGGEVNYAPYYLTNAELYKLAENNFMLENHGYFHDMSGAYLTYGMTQETNISKGTNYIFEKTGIIPRVWVTPNDDEGYNSFVESQQYMAATSQGVADGYPTQPSNPYPNKFSNAPSIGEEFNVFRRDFNTDYWNDPTKMANLKEILNMLAAQASPSSKLLYRLATHGINDWNAFKSYIDHLESVADDKIWVTSLQELLEYLEVKRLAGMSETLQNNTLTIEYDLNSIPPENHFMDMSIIVNSDANVVGVTVEGADSFSFNTSGLVNISLQNKKSKTQLVLPIANAGADQAIYLATTTVSFSGSASVAPGEPVSQWIQISGPTSAVIASPNNLNSEIAITEKGAYVFELRVRDGNGRIATDDLKIIVKESLAKENVVHIEAEEWTAMSGVGLENTSDVGAGKNVAWIDNGDWMDYEIALVTPGMVRINFRIATPNTGGEIKVLSGSGSLLATINVPATGDYQTWKEVSCIVPLSAGKQIIRIISSSNAAFNLNWLDLSMVNSSALPVKISDFNTVCTEGGIDIIWKTAQEDNTAKFFVQESADGRQWTYLTTIPAAGNSRSELTYQYRYRGAVLNKFYRIQEQDVDGRLYYSSTRQSNCSGSFKFRLQPNLTTQDVVILLSNEYKGIVNVMLYSMNGALVKQSTFNKQTEVLERRIQIGELAEGEYLLVISDGKTKHSTPVFKF